MKLFEYKPGVYSISNVNGNFRPSEEVVLGVHLYFPRSLTRYNPYYERMEDFVSEYNGPLVILEGEDSFNGTVEAIERLGRIDKTFFIKTIETEEGMDPEPVEIGWKGLSNFLEEFNPETLKLIGGQYKNPFMPPRSRGCLGLTKHILKKRGFSIKTLRSKGLTYN